ncbi:MAG: hypothetical protein DRQ88_05915 [Epsilonproteobacteria bacterium]|nr:MAG: hypothetical protein DRQ88_05915 [Campylobacterota bacterium]
MKGILEFNLDEYEERKEHRMAIDGWKAHNILNEIPNLIFRPIHKYDGHSDYRIKKVLDQYPEQLDAFIDLAWAMSQYYNAIIQDSEVVLDE